MSAESEVTPVPDPPAETPLAAETLNEHADKYDDPRAKFGAKGWLAVVAIAIGATIFALASVAARRTQLGETTRFYGPEVIQAIQLGDHVMLVPQKGSDFETVELTAFPGLGHLRKALLDEGHYEWETETSESVAEFCDGEDDVKCVRLEFSDPSLNRFETARIDIELNRGIVGLADKASQVKVNDRVRPALQHQIGLLMRVKQKRYDRRD
ncbi:hypothetical protein SAMN06265222_101150 [Neorhodopirellula lusitana]|uniref:Transmembrane protein n=1 Tax=Neorhodopirellula lusitana TaxID=445327 RepID=A0ABY1PN26_9BACT|nr:hypothetical protein [Neorhodopirellula lusitana]SMP38518.1 hypothetical protein SAMN06265222_101150 [Neorhodopirellula lusitana]